jgi:Mlc titration factor MtfA (ptsG expression regulator)
MSLLPALLSRWWPVTWMPDAWILAHRPIPELLWQRTLVTYPFLGWRTADRQQQLRQLATLFVARKQFTPLDSLELTDDMAVAIAAQACLPVLRWGLAPYASFVGVVIRADQVVARREWMDEAGVVHHHEEVLAGEAQPDGPIMLTWSDVLDAAQAHQGYNVVVHEFAHALDMRNGPEADGCPPLPRDMSRAEWLDTLWQGFDAHRNALAHGDPTWLDPYAASEGLVEFFPVVCEAFFTAPHQLQREQPAVYALLCRYFQEAPHEYAPTE